MKLIKKIKIIIYLILTFLCLENLLASEILFEKKGIIITSNDLENFKNLHKDYHGVEIGTSGAIKSLYMIFKIVDIQIRDNPNFIKITNNIIQKDIQKYKEKYSEYIMSYFLRYEILKNDFIMLHIDKNGPEMLDTLFDKKISLYLDDSCKKINKIIDFDQLSINQKKVILKNISNDSILIEEKNYVCFSQEDKETIYNLTNGKLSAEGYDKFLEYVHKYIK